MKLTCYACEREVEIGVIPKGPHLKAICTECGRYIKFLNAEEKAELEREEDEKILRQTIR